MSLIAKNKLALRVKGRELYFRGLQARRYNSVSEMARLAGISRATASNLVNNSEFLTQIHLDGLSGLLLDALGITPEALLELPLGEVFQLLPYVEISPEEPPET